MTEHDNKALWIFPNIREAVNCLPEELRGEAYRVMIEYGFGEEVKTDQLNPMVKMAFELAKPFLRLRGVAGAPAGNQNAKKEEKNNIEKQSKTILLNNQNNSFNNENKNKNVNKNDNNNEKYGELNNVRLTAEQYHTLKTKHSNIDDAIEVLDTWLGTSGSKHKDKNHYAYFKENSWVWDRVSQLPAKQNDDWLERLEREGNNETANQVGI
jgi:hypothetical protein